LDLSLSYGVVKAHGGEIKEKTRVNKPSEFISGVASVNR